MAYRYPGTFTLFESDEKYRRLFDMVELGFAAVELQFDGDGVLEDLIYLEANSAFDRQSGLTDVVGKRMSEVMPGFERYWLDICGRVHATGQAEVFENYAQTTGQWYRSHVSGFGHPDDKVVAVVFENITERKGAEIAVKAKEARQAFLLKLNDALRALSDPAEIQYAAAQTLGEHLGADRVGYAEDQAGSGQVLVTRNYVNGVKGIEGIYQYSDYGSELIDGLRAGKTVIKSDVANDPGLTKIEKTAHAVLDLGATVNVPLVKGGQLYAILFLHYKDAHNFSETELELLQEVAERTWAEVMRARAEHALIQNERRLAVLFDSLPLGVSVFDQTHDQSLSNAAMQRYLPNGKMPSLDEERGWRWRGWDADGQELPRNQYPGTRALRGERVVPGTEMLYKSDDGKETWVSVSAVPITDDNGAVTGQIGIIQDIDAGKRDNINLRNSEARWRVLTDVMPHLVWIGEARQGGSVYINEQFAQYIGQPVASLQGLRWLRAIHPDDLNAVKIAWRKAGEDFGPLEVEFRLRRHDGAYRWFLGRAVPSHLQDGETVQWIGVCADIQLQMEARFKAEAADRAKSEFLANMSHEIRTPLNAIVGLTSILTTLNADPKMYPIYFQTMLDSANTLQELIDGLLDFARLDAEMVELNETETVLSDLISEVERISAVKAIGKDVALVVHDTTPKHKSYVADGHRIKQILLNLLSNALKFTDRGVVCLMAEAGEPIDGRETVVFSVQDTGIGIPSDKLDLIFEKFTQADGSHSRRFGGTGLGLAISKRLANTLGGTLTVQSQVGEGSTFILTVPMTPLPAVAIQRSSGEKWPRLAGRHVLLIEDNPTNRVVAQTMLEQLGCSFDTAGNGRSAIEKWRTGQFDLVLLDIQMPDMDGLTVARRIRQMEREEARAPVKIVAMTAHAFADDRDRAFAAGMNDYLSKPFTVEALQKKLVDVG